jgi:membrane protein DedA with SNARE-associated domain
MEAYLMPLITAHPWILYGGYIAIFIVMLFEGPFITAFGGLLSALGILDIRIVLLLSILGNFIPDIAYYTVGYFTDTDYSGKKSPKEIVFTRKTVALLKERYKRHPFATLLAVKLIPHLASFGLIIAGAARMPIRKCSLMSLSIILVTSSAYIAIGYCSGATHLQFVHHQIIAFVPIGIIAATLIYLFKRSAKKLGERIIGPSLWKLRFYLC